VTYTSTSSGQALAEFGIPGGVLKKRLAVLDAFVGTDDPPTKAQLTEAEKASGSRAVVMPVVSAPIAVIVHLPAECLLKGTVGVTNENLSLAFAQEGITFETFLGAANVENKDVAKKACQVEPMVDVRSDESGTSYAFKQYLCQVKMAVWGAAGCESGEGFVSDNTKWPKEVASPETPLRKHKAGVTANEGSKGEVEAVEEEAGSIGYVNLANAAAVSKFLLSKEDAELFWVNIEGLEEGVKEFFDPLLTTEPTEPAEADCSTGFKLTAALKLEAEKSEWAKVHLASPETSGAYPLCTLTYDIGWENYLTATLEASGNYTNAATAGEIGDTAKNYFEYMSKAGQTSITSDYTKLPAEVKLIAEKLAEKLTP